jgi:hypothetical protein
VELQGERTVKEEKKKIADEKKPWIPSKLGIL